MGGELVRLIVHGAPPGWTAQMRLVAMVIADDARDPSQGPPEDGGSPWSSVPIRGRASSKGKWRDGLTERTGMSERAIRRALADLAAAGYEMREQIGTDKKGRPVVAYSGRASNFRVRPLRPRDPPAAEDQRRPDSAAIKKTRRRPDSAAIKTSDPAAVDGAARQERRPNLAERRPNLVTKAAESGRPSLPVPPTSIPTPSAGVSDGSLEGVRDRGGGDADNDDFETRRRKALDALGRWKPADAYPPETATPSGDLAAVDGAQVLDDGQQGRFLGDPPPGEDAAPDPGEDDDGQPETGPGDPEAPMVVAEAAAPAEVDDRADDEPGEPDPGDQTWAEHDPGPEDAEDDDGDTWPPPSSTADDEFDPDAIPPF